MADAGRKNGVISVIADEDTVTGFLLAGIGDRDIKGKPNFLVVEPDKTRHEDIVKAFKAFTARKDMSIILISQTIAEEIRYILKDYSKTIPTVLEIPSKNVAYDESKDPIMQRVLALLGVEQ